MISLSLPDDFEEWRTLARRALAAGFSPEQVLWQDGLFGQEDVPSPDGQPVPGVPKDFIPLARTVSHHTSPSRWAFLYRVLWRLTRGGERHLLKVASDPDIVELEKMRKDIGRDVHKMHAFVRFKKVGEDPETGREQFVAWFEPSHQIMPLTANFFRKRFTGMDWSIFTPTGCAHWDGQELRLEPGIAGMVAPSDVELEDLWRTYYKSIFNPARVKPKAMQAEMPKKYWHNLPEASLISELMAQASRRVGAMMEEEGRTVRELRNNYLQHLQELTTKAEQDVRPGNAPTLDTLREAASACRACPLHEKATRTVFGEGPPHARIMIVGEQPGDQEDLAGRPFIGPAGKLLDRALKDAGIDRSQAYLTNAVKHFKWKRQGKQRLHQNPSTSERHLCRPWLLGELELIRPEVLICLGTTAAQSLIDPQFRVMADRGLVQAPHLAPRVIATVHPSFLLRSREQEGAEYDHFVTDLRLHADR